jgi:hypothetical protein
MQQASAAGFSHVSPCLFLNGRGQNGVQRSVEVLRQLEVFDDITALIDSQPVASNCCFWGFCNAAVSRHQCM